MAFDEGLAQRVREALQAEDILCDEKRMFGGLAFMVNGHMCVGITGDDLMARVGAGDYETALGEPHVREMDFTRKPLKGFVYVASEGLAEDRALAAWIDRCLGFVRSLPPK